MIFFATAVEVAGRGLAANSRVFKKGRPLRPEWSRHLAIGETTRGSKSID
jgi:hypothetical protein